MLHISCVKVKEISFMCLHMILAIIIMCNVSYAGNIIEVDGFMMYLNDVGQIAKEVWVWIDTNKNSIAECYRFDSNGHLAINYVDKYGRETNDKGQFIENGEVIKKMLSSGEILNKKDTPEKGILESEGHIINIKNKNKNKMDKWTNKKVEIIEYETNGIKETIDGQILYAKNSEKNIDILNGETAESGTIYAGGKALEISDGEINTSDKKIVAGKSFLQFISKKNKCTEKVKEVYIYNGDKWNNVMCLSGNEASVKLNLNGNNYIYFEVAHQTHGETTRDTDITLDIYVDGELVERLDEFVDDDPQVFEEYFDDAKNIELKVNIKSGATGRRVYIRNGILKKIKNKD